MTKNDILREILNIGLYRFVRFGAIILMKLLDCTVFGKEFHLPQTRIDKG